LAVLAVGCGDDGDGATSGEEAPDAGSDTVTSDADAETTDEPDSEPEVTEDSRPDPDVEEPFIPTESEPNTADEPNAITIPTTVLGTIGAPIEGYFGPEADTDFFAFDADAGTVLELSYLSGEIQAFVQVMDNPEEGPTFFRAMDAANGTTRRQLFIPADGEYLLVIADSRNFDYYLEELFGGDDVTYEVLITIADTPTPEPSGLPLEVANGGLLPTRGVRIYELDIDEAGLLVADVDATELDPPSDFDPALVLMNGSLDEMIAQNDDEDSGAGRYDSLLRHVFEEEASVNLVLDYFMAGENNRHEMSVIYYTDLTREYEPNDGISTAWPLPVTAAEEELEPVTGTIGTPPAGDVGDLDWYLLGEQVEGDAIVIEVVPADDSLIQPELFVGLVLEGFFGSAFNVLWSSQTGVDGNARIEATALFDGTYYAVVAEADNSPPEDADEEFVLEAVGGDDYGYAITAVQFERHPTTVAFLTVVDSEQSLSQTGEVDWFELDTGSDDGGLLVISALGEAIEPTLFLFDRTPIDQEEGDAIVPVIGSLFDSGTQWLATQVDADTAYSFAVWNTGEWTAASEPYLFSLEILEEPEPYIEDDDYSNSSDGALLVEQVYEIFHGEIDGLNEESHDTDVFGVPLSAGNRLIAETFSIVEPLPEGEEPEEGDPFDADTVMELKGPSINSDEEAVIDDDGGSDSFMSRIDFDVPEGGAGTYYLEVAPFCDAEGCIGGHYGLRILVLE
jgi:hypothetical protein